MALNFNHPIVLMPLIIALIILATIIVFLVKGRKNGLLFSFTVFLGMMFFWTLGQVFQYGAGNDFTIRLSQQMVYFAICFIALAWLVFVLVYINSPILAKLKKIIPLFILPVLAWMGLLTDPYHHQYFNLLGYDPGKPNNLVILFGNIFWITALYSYLYMLAGFIILIQHTRIQTGQTKKQSLILLFASFITCTTTFFGDLNLFLTRATPPTNIDSAPIFFTVTILLFAVAAFRYRFLDILPGAFRKVVENIEAGVLIIDNNNYIVNFNPAFRGFFQDLLPIQMNQSLAAFMQKLRENCVSAPDALIFEAIETGSPSPAAGDICLEGPAPRYFKIKTQPVMKRNHPHGRIITFSDITEYQRMLGEIRAKNTELAEVNQALNEHLITIEELAIANERNRIARELHDSLGHTLTLVIMLMRAGKVESARDLRLTREKLVEGIQIAEDGLRELRRSIFGLLADESQNRDMLTNLEWLIADCRASGTRIKLTVFGSEYYENLAPSAILYKISDVVYKITREAITNALRHGHATGIEVILRFEETLLKLFIVDNGVGCMDIIPGLGITGMVERVNTVGGNIVYGSDGERGFIIHVEIPLEGLGK